METMLWKATAMIASGSLPRTSDLQWIRIVRCSAYYACIVISYNKEIQRWNNGEMAKVRVQFHQMSAMPVVSVSVDSSHGVELPTSWHNKAMPWSVRIRIDIQFPWQGAGVRNYGWLNCSTGGPFQSRVVKVLGWSFHDASSEQCLFCPSCNWYVEMSTFYWKISVSIQIERKRKTAEGANKTWHTCLCTKAVYNGVRDMTISVQAIKIEQLCKAESYLYVISVNKTIKTNTWTIGKNINHRNWEELKRSQKIATNFSSNSQQTSISLIGCQQVKAMCDWLKTHNV